ncbi:hypothetical protein IVA98_27260 [Bradyrhizobium sp. 160]|uniref:hypothetical protein n=1 Tax=Bradyrhizobium sp. 160 TaxID=2782634 RepID=UPI001FF80C0D|nr:hypothetical protein [Bradyrhizobium sp. 160]MCK1626785.1 hypothetical protein [Bradyrhizobium sp. 160]
MSKSWLPQQAHSDDTIQQFAPTPRKMNDADPGCFGYWSKEEIMSFLKLLLDSERIGITAYAAIGRAADSHLADIAFEAELGQGAICVLLKKELVARGGANILRRNTTIALPSTDCSLRRRIAFASHNQIKLADMLEDAILNIFDSKLNAKLMYLLLLHRKQVEQLETLVT